MKCVKIFTIDSLDNAVQETENAMNAWLKDSPDIVIVSMTQSFAVNFGMTLITVLFKKEA